MTIHAIRDVLPKTGVNGKKLNILYVLALVLCLLIGYGCNNGEGSFVAPAIPLVSVDYEFDQFGGSGTITIGDVEGAITASCNQSWITGISANGATISFSVSPNTSLSSRVAQILITAGDVNTTVIITQASAMFTNQDEYTIDSEGGSYTLEMPTELEYSITTDPAATWITSWEITDEGLRITAEASISETPRSTSVSLVSDAGRTDRTFTITQSGYDFGIFPETLNFAVAGGPQSIVVSGNRDYSVTIEETWLTYEKTDEGGIFTATSNVGGNARTASVIFTDLVHGATKTITVTQDVDPSEYADFLGDWEIIDYSGNTYTVTFSEKVADQSFNMTSEAFPELTVEWLWSATNNGKRLTLNTQIVYTYPSGNLVTVVLYNPVAGTITVSLTGAYLYYDFDGSTLTLAGGSSADFSGFQFRERTPSNTAVGVYTGGPYDFRNAVLTKKN